MMEQTSNTFRIFVSSTFSDLHEERNALQKYVFPRLRELCLQNGCRFQAIDLRWGVSVEAGRDQQTMKICLEEIKRCQRVTPRPNFIVLLGDRYGWCPLPSEIPETEFEQIIKNVSDEDKAILLQDESKQDGQNGWYRKDDNAVPPIYCLQERGKEYEEHSDWEKVERRLRAILENAVDGVNFDDEKERAKYVASATEQEINQGLNSQKATEHVFCFFRQITNQDDLIADLPQQKKAKDFIELNENNSPNKVANEKLENLKKRLCEQLPKQNVHEYKAQWLGNGADSKPKSLLTHDHIGTLPDDLEECLKLLDDENAPKNLCVDVWRQLALVMREEIANIESVTPVQREKEEHEKFGKERSKNFVGRASYLESISQYVNADDQHPFALWGGSGSGKSALMAYAAKQISEKNPNDFLIVRFIGATPQSSDIRALLESLCHEISDECGADQTTIPTDYNELIKEFEKLLDAAKEKQKRLVIMLDALDQLSDAENAQNLRWLPDRLPENVRLIISTLPDDSLKILKTLERKLPAENIIQLKPLPESEGKDVLDLWLADAERTLTNNQRTEVLNKFAENGLPLYLKFAFEEARLWHSYAELKPLSANVEGIIGDLFKRLSDEANHGSMMVSHALGYLAAARYGLTEDELIEVLWQDDAIKEDFHHRSPKSPEVDSLPVVVWSRLYFDLEPYMTERMANNISLLSFYHRQFGEIVDNDFLKDYVKQHYHFKLSDYFEKQKLYLKEEPEILPNLRKMSELPYQLIKANLLEKVEKMLCDLRFLDTKCRAELARDILSDFEASENFGSQQTIKPTDFIEWRDFIKKNVQRLSKHPRMLVALANHEGFENARKQATSIKWSFPWLRTSPEKMPTQEISKSEGLQAHLTNQLELPRGQAIAIAEKNELAFWFEQLGKVRVLDIRKMCQTENVLSIRRERPLTMISDPDGKSLAVFYESGDAELYRCIFGSDNLPNSLESVLTFQYFLPECEDPIVKWFDGAYWFQSKENEISYLITETLQILKKPLPDEISGELSALVFVGNKWLLAFRQGANSLLYFDDKQALKIAKTDINSACYCGNQKVAVAFTNGSIVIYEVDTEIIKQNEIETEVMVGELGWNNERLFWTESPRNLVSWNLSESTSKVIQDNQEILPLRLLVIPKYWLKKSESTILLVANNKLATFYLEDGGLVSKSKIKTLFGGQNWQAVKAIENNQWLLGRNQTNEMLLAKSSPRLYCGIDGQNFLYAPDGKGQGLVLNLKDFLSKPIKNCPLGINVACGDVESGCWLTDRLGDIYYVSANGQCRLIEKIGLQGAKGAIIYAFDNYLIWFGQSDKWVPDAGVYSARTFVFFRREIRQKPHIERISEKSFTIGDGKFHEILFDSLNRRLVIVWESHDLNRFFLRIAKIKDFINDVYLDQELDKISFLKPFNIALSKDGRWLGLVSELGELHFFRVRDGKEIAVLAGNSQFSAIATGEKSVDFWLVEANQQIFHGNLENAL